MESKTPAMIYKIAQSKMGTPVFGGNAHSNTSTENIKTPATNTSTENKNAHSKYINRKTNAENILVTNNAGIDDSM